MNVEIWAEAALFPEKENINGIAVAVCRVQLQTYSFFYRFAGLFKEKSKMVLTAQENSYSDIRVSRENSDPKNPPREIGLAERFTSK
jgi:hypothetical protein